MDVLIVGAGPAGLFAAHELATKSELSVLVVDMGREIGERSCPAVETGRCARCEPCHIMCGVGGAGGMSSGTLNLRPDVGGELSRFTKNAAKAQELVKEVDEIFLAHGAPNEIYGVDEEGIERLTRRAAAAGVRFIPIPQRHIGSEYLPKVIGSFKRDLEKHGVKFMLNSKVEKLSKGEAVVEGKKLKAKYILAAPGRVGAVWFAQQAKALGIELSHGPIDVGVRVEVPAVVMEPVIRVSRDPKFHIITRTFDDFMRTFCVHPGEPVFYQNDGIFRFAPIEEVPTHADLISVNLATEQLHLIKPECKTVRHYKGKMVRINFWRGGEICVTADHPLFVKDCVTEEEKRILHALRSEPLRSEILARKLGLHVAHVRSKLKRLLRAGCLEKIKEGKFVFYRWVKDPILNYAQKRAEDISPGQLLPSLRRLPKPKMIVTEINLIEEFEKFVPKEFQEKIIIRGTEKYIREIKEKTGLTCKELTGAYGHDRIRFTKLLELMERYPPPPECLETLKLGLRGSTIELPAVLPLTPELARMLGYFVAEGNYNFNKKYGNYFIAFTNKKKWILEDIVRCVKNTSQETTHFITGSHKNQVAIPSLLHFLLLKHVFGIPSGARNKRLPRYVFNFPEDIQYNFLAALFAGDGHVGKDGIYYMTTSDTLRSELGYLLLQLGYPATHRKNKLGFAPHQRKPSEGYEYYLHISGKRNAFALAKKLNECLRAAGGKEFEIPSLPRYDRQVQTPAHQRDLYSRDAICDVKVRKVETFEYDGPVFDFSIPPYRTFAVGRVPIVVHNCVNYQGYVMEERYDDYVGVNGHSLRAKKSTNANFAFLVRVELTQPVTDTTAYGRSIAYLATTIGGGLPLLQRLGDLRRGRRSTWERIERGHVRPTLRSVTPGDISMALPGRIVTDILEGLERLDEVIPGVASDSTLLYAPEVKLYAMRIKVDEKMQTSVPNLFVAGDGAGLSRGIVSAAATGLLAARGILKKHGEE